MRHEARGARNGAWLLAGPAGVTHPSRESPKVSSSPPMTWRAKWSSGFHEVTPMVSEKTPWLKYIWEYRGDEKPTFFLVSFVCCNISESNFISDDGTVPSTRFQSIGWNETHVELTTFVFLQSQFLSSNRTKQLPFVGRKKTEGYQLLKSTFQKQMKNNRTKKKIQKHFPFPTTYSTSLYFSPKCQEIPEFWVPRQPMICPAYSSCWSQRWCRRYLVAAWELWRNNE